MLDIPVPSDRPRPKRMDPSERLFRHKRRPEWGIGLWVKEERTRRRMRFEDGELRTFKQGFYHLFRPVDPDKIEVEEVYEALAGEQERALQEKARAKAREDKPPVMSFEEQQRVFKAVFKGGFFAPAYLAAHRRPAGDVGARKAQVDASVALAQELLAAERLRGMVEAGDYAGIHAAACEVLASCGLVAPARDVKPVQALKGEAQVAFAKALVVLLHSEQAYRARFREWCRTLRKDCMLDARWRLATVLPALVHPAKHVCVRRRVTELQARSVLPGTTLRARPSAIGYRKARRVAKATARRLKKDGLQPQDLLDVFMFSWETLRPKGQRVSEGLP